MSVNTVEGFSISHAAVLNGTTGAELHDIYGVREGSLEIDMDTFDNTGDDVVLSTWYWFNYATLTVTSGYIPFDLVATLTGAHQTSSGAAPADYYYLPLWNKGSLNQPTRPVLLRIPAKDTAGVVRILDIVLFKVQFQPLSFDGPSYKDGLAVSYSGKALISSTNEVGASVVDGNGDSDPSIGRLVNRPG